MNREHFLEVLSEFVDCNRGDCSTINLLVSLGSQVLDISSDEMAEILDCVDEMEDE